MPDYPTASTFPTRPSPGESYFAPKSKNLPIPFGVKLDTSFERNTVCKLVGFSYLNLLHVAGLTNFRAVPNERLDLPTLYSHYPEFVPHFTRGPIEKFRGRIIIDDAYAVCAKCDDSISENVAITTWEGGRLPRFVAEGFKKFREVWVPNEEARQHLLTANVTVPVFVIPPVPVVRGPGATALRSQTNYILFATEALRDEAFNVVRAYTNIYTRADKVVLHVATPQTNWPPLKEFMAKLPSGAPYVTPVNIDISNPGVASLWFNQMDGVLADNDGGWNIVQSLALAYGVPVLDDWAGGRSFRVKVPLGPTATDAVDLVRLRWAELGWGPSS
jgi:hypothetical protein